MKRRDLLTGALAFASSAVISPSIAQTVRRKRLGYLSGGSNTTGGDSLDILRAALRDLGWRERNNRYRRKVGRRRPFAIAALGN